MKRETALIVRYYHRDIMKRQPDTLTLKLPTVNLPSANPRFPEQHLPSSMRGNYLKEN